ncbi:MAG: amidohydrolase [Magnetococcales bacterium]|nr:amidohydrolase [Magnetococcales bacterium]
MSKSIEPLCEFPIIDAHVHLDSRIQGGAALAARKLNDFMVGAGVTRAVVLHLESQPWQVEEVADAIAGCDRLVGFVNIHPHAPDCAKRLRHAIETLGFIGLKLHPRLQHFDLEEERSRNLVSLAGEMGVAVIVDAFPDGDWLAMGFSPLVFARMAQKCQKTRIILAHFGGHHCIDFMMIAKRIPNLYLDFSYSLLYYYDSPTVQSLLYCFRSMKYERIFFGSDYPDRPVADVLDASRAIFTECGILPTDQRKLFYENARKFFQWTDI